VKKFTTIVSIFFIFLFVYYILLNPEVLNIFEILTIQSIVILIFIKFIMLILNSLFNKFLVKAFEIDLLNFESLYIGSITFLGNLYLPGRIGGGFRLMYLNKTYNLKSSFLVSSLVYFFVISFFINSLIGFFSLFLNFEYLNSSLLIWLFIYGFSFLFSFYLLFKKFELKKIEEFKSKIFYKINSYFQEAKNGWNTITKFKNMNRNLISIYIINYIFFVIDIYLITTFINIYLSLSNVVFFNSINIFSGLIGLTPGSIGLKESLMFISINILELTFEELFQIILIERLISVVFSIIPLFVVITYNKKNKN
tara:strand:+ start:295 stop:1224 length:930 start_codon:yes stop_codon:yes gene_type:complete